MHWALHNARHKDDIVITCSTADEGIVKPTDVSNDSEAYLDLLSIAACDKWGGLLNRSQKDNVQFRFTGEDVQIGPVPFLRSSERITGSSVATAIAAGAASLVLACYHISARCYPDPLEIKPQKEEAVPLKNELVRKKFRDMGETSQASSPSSACWVRLENLCGRKAFAKKYDFKSLVDNSFVYPKT